MGVGPVLPIINQPADSDLTAIAALVTTSYGRSLLTTADVDALAVALAARPAYSSRYVLLATSDRVDGEVPVWDAGTEQWVSGAGGGGGGAEALGYVNHGSTAGTARPSGYAAIVWLGSVEPTNATNGDVWIPT